MRFEINDDIYQFAFEDELLKQDPLYFAVSMDHEGDSVEIVNF